MGLSYPVARNSGSVPSLRVLTFTTTMKTSRSILSNVVESYIAAVHFAHHSMPQVYALPQDIHNFTTPAGIHADYS